MTWSNGMELGEDIRGDILDRYNLLTVSMRKYKRMSMFTSVLLLASAFFIGVVWYSDAFQKLTVSACLLWLIYALNWMLSYVFYRYPIQITNGNFKFTYLKIDKVYKRKVKCGRIRADKLDLKADYKEGDTIMLIKLSDAVRYAYKVKGDIQNEIVEGSDI